jgi:hypothetical protein
MIVTLSNAIFLDRKNRENAIKQARQAAQDIHKKNVSGDKMGVFISLFLIRYHRPVFGSSLKVPVVMTLKSTCYPSRRVLSTWLFKHVCPLYLLSLVTIMIFIVQRKSVIFQENCVAKVRRVLFFLVAGY